MRLPRRRLLALLSTGVAGCGGAARGGEPRTPAGPASGPEPTRTGPSVSPQSVSVGNTRPTRQFVTVAVERAGETRFVESRELVPGERHTTGDVLSTGGTYDAVVDTADGSRTTYRWTVVDELDGLAVTLADGIDVVRTVRCGPDCALGDGERLDAPLVGDGSARWYAPAQVVLANPGASAEAEVTVSLDGRTLVDARYRVPHETQVVVPLTYRSGTYRVGVETAAGGVVGDWRVPEEPSRVVDFSTLAVGCGPGNTQLRIENDDDRSHAVRVAVEREGTVRFAERYRLDPGERRAVVPVAASGRYEVCLRSAGGTERTWTWWACPPHGPATAAVDATGTATFSQSGL
ncbi:hypothetical protein [Salinigranum marinum]|uniref:hypothetical protein n=1 Tax=Salinigranum marinum TaxID=1515595 RepID=UPI002989B9FB|nr:hypothetical protein [Salinigranum marinum]